MTSASAVWSIGSLPTTLDTITVKVSGLLMTYVTAFVGNLNYIPDDFSISFFPLSVAVIVFSLIRIYLTPSAGCLPMSL